MPGTPGATGPTGPTGATGPSGLDDTLTRIVSLSWRHNSPAVSSVDLVTVTRATTSSRTRGFLVAFGNKTTSDPNELRAVTFGPGMIDLNTFEMYVDEPLAATTPGLGVWARLDTDRIELIPVKIDSLAGDLITKATEIPLPAGVTTVQCNGAGFVWDDDFFGVLKGRQVMVQIKGDFIPDVPLSRIIPARAVDANFLLGRLPTGDRVAGGTFWSFFTVSGR